MDSNPRTRHGDDERRATALFSYSFKLRKRRELSIERVGWTHTVSLAQYLIYDIDPCKLGSQPPAPISFLNSKIPRGASWPSLVVVVIATSACTPATL